MNVHTKPNDETESTDSSFGFSKKFKKVQKNLKKGVDKGKGAWYYSQAPSSEGKTPERERATNLENDTGKKKKRKRKSTVDSGNEFSALGYGSNRQRVDKGLNIRV